MKKIYVNPTSQALEMSVEQIIATSGDAGGTIKPSPWGSNKRNAGEAIWGSEK